MKEQIVINNLLINYYKVVNQKGKNIIFLHGWRCDANIWQNIAKDFSEYSLYLLDLPGFGSSATPNRAFNVNDYAKVVAEFINKLKLKDIILVGHSVGGRIVIKLAAENPKEIEKIVLVDSAGFTQKRKGIEKVAKMVKPFFRPKFMQPLRKKIYQGIGAGDYLETPNLQQTFLNIINEDLTECLPKIKVPTLIFWGEKDKETPVEFAKKMNATINNSKLVVIPNAGHFSFLDKPEEFVAAVKEFSK